MIPPERNAIRSRQRMGIRLGVTQTDVMMMTRRDHSVRDQCDTALDVLAKSFFDDAAPQRFEAQWRLGEWPLEQWDDGSTDNSDPEVFEALKAAQHDLAGGASDEQIAAALLLRLGEAAGVRGGVALYCRVVLARLRDELTHPYIAAGRLWSAGLHLDNDYCDCLRRGQILGQQWEEQPERRVETEQKIRALAKHAGWPAQPGPLLR